MEQIKSKSALTQAVQEYPDFLESLDFIDSKSIPKKCKMYLLVNKSLNLSAGKVASQVGHAVEKLTLKYKQTAYFKAFRQQGNPKIVLSVPTEEKFIEILDSTKKFFKVYIIDEGLTECQRNSVTVVGFGLLFENEIPSVLKTLSLYR